MTIYIFFRALYMLFLSLLPLMLAALHAPLHNTVCGWDKTLFKSCFLWVVLQYLKVTQIRLGHT